MLRAVWEGSIDQTRLAAASTMNSSMNTLSLRHTLSESAERPRAATVATAKIASHNALVSGLPSAPPSSPPPEKRLTGTIIITIMIHETAVISHEDGCLRIVLAGSGLRMAAVVMAV